MRGITAGWKMSLSLSDFTWVSGIFYAPHFSRPLSEATSASSRTSSRLQSRAPRAATWASTPRASAATTQTPTWSGSAFSNSSWTLRTACSCHPTAGIQQQHLHHPLSGTRFSVDCSVPWSSAALWASNADNMESSFVFYLFIFFKPICSVPRIIWRLWNTWMRAFII